ncbi:hypothetical protein J6590_033693 [Homalodisca vitripennis]|nr:hypothetical protein J6590_033693 [Homalodisca vitripennis]
MQCITIRAVDSVSHGHVLLISCALPGYKSEATQAFEPVHSNLSDMSHSWIRRRIGGGLYVLDAAVYLLGMRMQGEVTGGTLSRNNSSVFSCSIYPQQQPTKPNTTPQKHPPNPQQQPTKPNKHQPTTTTHKNPTQKTPPKPTTTTHKNPTQHHKNTPNPHCT